MCVGGGGGGGGGACKLYSPQVSSSLYVELCSFRAELCAVDSSSLP